MVHVTRTKEVTIKGISNETYEMHEMVINISNCKDNHYCIFQ